MKQRLSLLISKKQIILYGPPGTGKTYNTKEIAVSLLSGYTEEEDIDQLSVKHKVQPNARREKLPHDGKTVPTRHEHKFYPDKGVLVLKSIKRYKEGDKTDVCNFDTRNFEIIRDLERKFTAAKTRVLKDAIFTQLKDLECIKNAYEETDCIGNIREGRKDYKLAAVIRPVTKAADCPELNKRSEKQGRYYEAED
jgi:adenylate kinase family enzyme